MVLYWRVAGSLAGLSMVGSGLIILSYTFATRLRTHPFNLVFYLALCDFCFSLKWFVSSLVDQSTDLETDPLVCALQAGWGQFWLLGSVSWNGVIAYTLLRNLFDPFLNTARMSKFYHAFVWFICIVTTTIVLLAQFYGPTTDNTCWITDGPQRLLFYGPLLFFWLVALLALVVGIRTFPLILYESNRARRTVLLRMVLFTAVFIVSTTGAVVHRAAEYFQTDNSDPLPEYLRWWDMIGTTSVGLANALVWLSHPLFYQSVRDRLAGRPHRHHQPPVRPAFASPSPSPSPLSLTASMSSSSSSDSVSKSGVRTPLLAARGGQPPVVAAAASVPLALAGGEGAADADDASSESVRRYTNSVPVDEEEANRDVVQYLDDFTGVDLVLRKSIIAGLLRGIRLSSLDHEGDDGSAGLHGLRSATAAAFVDGDFRAEVAPEARVGDDVDGSVGGGLLYKFRAYSPVIFRRIRYHQGIAEEEFRDSMDPVRFFQNPANLSFSEGRSGSFFALSPDHRFILKTVPASEKDLLLSILLSYAEHISDEPHSLLPRFYGCFSVAWSGFTAKMHVVVMSNIFYGPTSIDERYDVKGSWIRRYTREDVATGRLGMDLDLRRKLPFTPEDQQEFLRIVTSDVDFLRGHGLMDYSMLLGYHVPRPQQTPDDRPVLNQSAPALLTTLSAPVATARSTREHDLLSNATKTDKNMLRQSSPAIVTPTTTASARVLSTMVGSPSETTARPRAGTSDVQQAAKLLSRGSKSSVAAAVTTTGQNFNSAAAAADDDDADLVDDLDSSNLPEIRIYGDGDDDCNDDDLFSLEGANNSVKSRSSSLRSSQPQPDQQQQQQQQPVGMASPPAGRRPPTAAELEAAFRESDEVASASLPAHVQFDGGRVVRRGHDGDVQMAGIIDILQPYNLRKKTERFVKKYFLRLDAEGMSVQSPDVYADRFLARLRNLTDLSRRNFSNPSQPFYRR